MVSISTERAWAKDFHQAYITVAIKAQPGRCHRRGAIAKSGDLHNLRLLSILSDVIGA